MFIRMFVRFANLKMLFLVVVFVNFVASFGFANDKVVIHLVFVEDGSIHTRIAQRAFAEFNSVCASHQVEVAYFKDGSDVKWEHVRGCSLVLTDIYMPIETGHRMVRRLVAERPEGSKKPKFIAITSDFNMVGADWRSDFEGVYQKIGSIYSVRDILSHHLPERAFEIMHDKLLPRPLSDLSEKSRTIIVSPATAKSSVSSSPTPIEMPGVNANLPRSWRQWFKGLCCGCF